MNTNNASTLPGGYCHSRTAYSRFRTREVAVGDVPLGGQQPIRVQSMTVADTMDTRATVEQSVRMIEAGCEYVRITAPSIREAENLANIKRELRARGLRTPLVADIHFTPNAAETAARIVEKVRINPGNYADKKKFAQIEYSEASYQAELERIYQKFAPLVRICKEYGTAMRIGTNHGSLSDRIMSRYGDTPEGMVESALEFIRICEDLSYRSLVVSMKSSNPRVMVEAYRLLAEKMAAEQMCYPLHLGVTEAGDGEDGRIKSAVGIGTLLEDGLGDTIRVSLTEDPEMEIPVARALADRYHKRKAAHEHSPAREIVRLSESAEARPYEAREVNAFIGGSLVPRVVVDISAENLKDPYALSAVGYRYDGSNDKFHIGDQSVDFVYLGSRLPSFRLPGNLKVLYDYPVWLSLTDKQNKHPVHTLAGYNRATRRDPSLNLVRIRNEDLLSEDFAAAQWDGTVVLVVETGHPHGMAEQRQFFGNLQTLGLNPPVIVSRHYAKADFSGPVGDFASPDEPVSKLQVHAATDLGALLLDGLGSGIWIDSPATPTAVLASVSFGILQATRSRISKTEYISCPSCGRTLFDLQETTQLIRARTSHLKGLKIGIMGCIVNGPGEMADADYGYVGAGPDKITLYRGKEVVKKNVSAANALDELIGIIKADGKWIDNSPLGDFGG